jgi:hypothetical protein
VAIAAMTPRKADSDIHCLLDGGLLSPRR